MTYNDEASVAAAKSMTYIQVQIAAVAFVLEVRGGNLIMRKKSRNSVAANTVPVTVVPSTVRQEPVYLELRMRQRPGASSSSTSPLSLAWLTTTIPANLQGGLSTKATRLEWAKKTIFMSPIPH